MINHIHELFSRVGRRLNIMEVCGTHTVSIFKHGIRDVLPDGLNLLSGPGCPVCVTSVKDIDTAIALSRLDNKVLITFGDMMRVPGSGSSLYEARAEGADIRIVYSVLDCLKIARENIDKDVIFFSAGFETTSPLIAATVCEAERLGIDNLSVYSVNKLVPPALDFLLRADNLNIDGFILPGHVSAIIGSLPYAFISHKYSKPCVISGFDAMDILASIALILKQIEAGRASIDIQYMSVVTENGNEKAVGFINDVFETYDAYWRGIGKISNSGLKLNDKWAHRDAEKKFNVTVGDYPEPSGCSCGSILTGLKTPSQCPLFGKKCTPESPVGACMVSNEGTCSAYYKYRIPVDP